MIWNIKEEGKEVAKFALVCRVVCNMKHLGNAPFHSLTSHNYSNILLEPRNQSCLKLQFIYEAMVPVRKIGTYSMGTVIQHVSKHPRCRYG